MRRIVKSEPGHTPEIHEIGGASLHAPLPPPTAAPPAPPPGSHSLPAARPPAAARPAQGVIKQEVYDAYHKAREILQAAEAEAARLRHEAEHWRREREKEGYEAGYKAGFEEALKGLQQLKDEQEKRLDDTEAGLLQLSIKVAEKIVGAELASRPDAIADIVGQALKAVRHQREIRIRVHPSHADILERRRASLKSILSRAPDVRIQPDPGVRPGGCVIESEVGTIDGELTTQLDMLERALKAAAGKG